ncbi:hypothetical protein EFA46_003845 [Halarchaeum sp. CBA1220]|uniref:DUF7553 family protein n=1 Tax=Halarchaeum sp. CBA1220 TaxID=1853682 RepID=UPI000F3A836F|nr:hypothetical protein [Halarchaeum sp. CBA1220]QLC33372.1 hypothetical protein EFA46_003845 [Halarchaeum sp. CBA1220]
MALENLQDASETLEQAAADAEDDEIRERITTQAEQLGKLAERERGPDHGRLARHMHALQDLVDDTDGDLAAQIDDALASVRAYRETVSGV